MLSLFLKMEGWLIGKLKEIEEEEK